MEGDPPLPPVVRVRRSEALEEALRRRRPRDMAERTFPSSVRFGPGRACQDLQGEKRGDVLEIAVRDVCCPVPSEPSGFWIMLA